jgi:hypothetical protein
MAEKHDWIPTNHEDLHGQAEQTVGYLTAPVRNRIGLGAETPIGVWYDTVFIPKCTSFCTAFDNWLNPSTRTKVTSTVLKTEQEDFVTAYRQLYNGFLRKNALVTDADLVSMGLPPHSSGGGKPSKIATTFPWIKILTHLIRHLIIEFGASETSRAKLDGQHGAEVVYIVSDEKPTDISQLIHSVFDTDSPLDLEFTEEERGKTVWFAIRWENTRGQKGPWSEIYSAIIP